MRVHSHLARRYIIGGVPSLPVLATYRGIPVSRIQYRLRRSLTTLLTAPSWASPPRRLPLIAIADAIWQWIEGVRYTLYLIIIKPLHSPKAIICPPMLRGGDETLGWPEAFMKLPRAWRGRICALICDGNIGLVSLAYHQRWALQRCHAHLRRYLNNYISRSPKSRHRELGEEVHALATILLTSRDRMAVAQAALKLRKIYHTVRSRSFRYAISGLIKHTREFRTYLEYPELDLPTTTNAVESLNSMIRELQRTARGFSSPQSFLRWVTAVLMVKQKITCNGKFQPKK